MPTPTCSSASRATRVSASRCWKRCTTASRSSPFAATAVPETLGAGGLALSSASPALVVATVQRLRTDPAFRTRSSPPVAPGLSASTSPIRRTGSPPRSVSFAGNLDGRLPSVRPCAGAQRGRPAHARDPTERSGTRASTARCSRNHRPVDDRAGPRVHRLRHVVPRPPRRLSHVPVRDRVDRRFVPANAAGAQGARPSQHHAAGDAGRVGARHGARSAVGQPPADRVGRERRLRAGRLAVQPRRPVVVGVPRHRRRADPARSRRL